MISIASKYWPVNWCKNKQNGFVMIADENLFNQWE